MESGLVSQDGVDTSLGAVGIGEGVSPADLGVWRSVVSSPAGSGAEPQSQTPFQHFLSVTERFRWKENAIILLNMVTDKVENMLD